MGNHTSHQEKILMIKQKSNKIKKDILNLEKEYNKVDKMIDITKQNQARLYAKSLIQINKQIKQLNHLQNMYFTYSLQLQSGLNTQELNELQLNTQLEADDVNEDELIEQILQSKHVTNDSSLEQRYAMLS